jgi:hypothetical protein
MDRETKIQGSKKDWQIIKNLEKNLLKEKISFRFCCCIIPGLLDQL